MARPLSEDRRAALLGAAARVIAEHGLSASTSLISKTARVSEGSFFTYFETKNDLIKALYRELRLDLAHAIMDEFPRRGTVRDRLEHMWTHYVTWGVENPHARKALRHVSMSKTITPAVRAEGGVLFAELDRLHEDAIAQRKLARVPSIMVSHTLKALAEMTMDLIEAQPEQASVFMTSGFGMLWGALANKG